MSGAYFDGDGLQRRFRLRHHSVCQPHHTRRGNLVGERGYRADGRTGRAGYYYGGHGVRCAFRCRAVVWPLGGLLAPFCVMSAMRSPEGFPGGRLRALPRRRKHSRPRTPPHPLPSELMRGTREVCLTLVQLLVAMLQLVFRAHALVRHIAHG